jgi:excisionase family DNA binding protein
MRRELESALMQAETLAPAELPRFLGDLEEIRSTAVARLTTPTAEPLPDELLDVHEAARRLSCSPDYLYRHHSRLPFTRRPVGRKLLFSSTGLQQYLKTAKKL